MSDSLLRPVSFEHLTEQDLISTAGRFVQSALDALSAHIAILDSAGSIIEVNAAWRRFAQDNQFTDPNYGIGINYLDVCDRAAQLNAPEAGVVADGIRQVMKRQSDEFVLEYPCHSPQQKRWFVVRISRFEWYGEMRLIVAHQNISELKHTQFELAESKRRIESIVDHVVDGIFAIRLNNTIHAASRPAGQIFGYDREAMIGMDIRTLLPEIAIAPIANEDAPPAPDCVPPVGQPAGHPVGHPVTHSGVRNFELVGRHRDGTEFPAYVALSSAVLDGEQVVLAIVQNITERKQLEAELIEKERLSIALEKERELRGFKNRFISMMSHELRTPLAAISLATDMLKIYGDRAPEEEKRQYLESIQVQVEHLMELVRDVIAISRADTAAQEYAPEQVDLETYTRGIIEEMQLAARKTHRITFHGTFKPVMALIDRKLMRQAITNLLTNAIKYSPQGGEIIVRLTVEKTVIILDVIDDGIGIPESDQKLLFEPFHRARNVDDIPGSGLGLAITKQAIELQGGRISFESRPGQGTTFTLWLPNRIAQS